MTRSVTAEPALVVVPHPERETLRVRGPDARSWLNGVVSADVAAVTEERGVYSLLLSKVGKVQTDLDVVADSTGLFVGVAPGLGGSTAGVLDRHLIMEDAELTLEAGLAWIHLHGPSATAAALAASNDGIVAWGSVDWLGVGGAALVVPRGRVGELASLIAERAGGSGVLASAEAWKALRLSRTFPEFGTDYGPDDNPHEAALDRRAVSWSKGCYLGQEVVCMQDLRGKLKRRLVLLRISGNEALPANAEVTAAGAAVVGQVTSWHVLDEDSAVLALARLKAPYFEGPTPLVVNGRPAEILTEKQQ